MYNWLYSWITHTEVESNTDQQSTPKEPGVYQIERGLSFAEALQNVKLKPAPDQKPVISFGQTIVDIKHRLKPVVQLPRCVETARHPVLKELLEKTIKKCP
jgi:hypothetical protein